MSVVVLSSIFHSGICFPTLNAYAIRSGDRIVQQQQLHSTSSGIQEKKKTRQKNARTTTRITNAQNINQEKSQIDATQKKEQPKKNQPWKANYSTSSTTQKRIKSASRMRASPIVRASTILKTLLKSDPVECNPSNLVCALTLSAKIVPKNAQRRHEFRHLLHQSLDILHDLVKKNQLDTRQLANVSWAIAKHYSMDEHVLPPTSSSHVSYTQGKAGDGSTVSLSERWDLDDEADDEDKYASERQVLETLELIADQLMHTMKRQTDIDDIGGSGGGNGGQRWRKELNEVEISMVCWAYAIVYPRNVPAGWELPPRVEQMEKLEKEAMERMYYDQNDGTTSSKKNSITFETVREMTSNSRVQDEQDFVPTFYADKLFDAMAKTIVHPEKGGMSMLQKCGWKELSTITWSYANRGYCQSNAALNLILNIADAAIARIEKASWVDGCDDILPRDLSEIAWSLGVMQSDNYSLSNSLEDFVTVINDNMVENGSYRPLKNWKSADCIQMAVALGHGRLDRQYFLKEIYSEALHSMKERQASQHEGGGNQNNFQDFELVVLLWVQARLYLTKELGQVFDDFAEMVPGILLYRMHMADSSADKSLEEVRTGFNRIRLGAQEQANLAWSLTVLEKYKSRDSIDILRCIFTVYSASCHEGALIRVEHGHQLWQSIFILEQECSEAIERVDEETFHFLKSMWEQEKARHKTSSARHQALSETLTFMGVQHYNEHDEDIDLALVIKTDSKWTHLAETSDDENYDKKQRIAVEFDGPSHFTKVGVSTFGKKPDKPRALGHTVLKYKLLRKAGWTIVRIPFYEFDKIPFWASMERQRYVQRKLKTHSNLQFSGLDVSEYKALAPNRNSRFD